MADITTEGWEGLNATRDSDALVGELTPPDILIHMNKCFATPSGRKVLKHLRSMTIEQAAWYPGAEASHGYAREGQDSIVRYIEQCIQRAKEFK
tara:strand:+ start:1062 stop:1343 length:282 start_codon:yes stop_codon:yes gene_type:complete